MPATRMWGERGLVASFFTDLSAVADCARWIAFLNVIDFVPPGPHRNWNAVNDVQAVVEPGYGNRGFGSPDAIARIEFTNDRSIVVLLEAKLGCYLDACCLPLMRGQRGFNSRLNGQLELNHCLTLALAQFQQGHHQLIDPQWVLHTPYVNARPAGRPRRVDNAIVIEQLVTPLINSDLYVHVIVTADQHNPLVDAANQSWLPQIFVDAQQGNQWNQHACRFGWTNWHHLLDLAANWVDPPARFPDNFAFNLPNVELRAQDDEPPAVAAQALPPYWPPGRPAKGVSLVFAPAINAQTFLHFSWLRNSGFLRNYIPDPAPPPDKMRTMDVLNLNLQEEHCGARRPPTTQVGQWRAIIQAVNQRYGLP